MARKIFDIDIEEISLVDRPANRKRFYIIKQEENMWDQEFEKLLTEFLGQEGFEELKKSVEKEIESEKKEKLTEEAINAIKGALNILNKYKDDFPKELKDAVKVIAQFAAKYPYPYPYPKKTKKDEEGNLIEELTDIEKAGRKLSKATVEQLRKVIEILQKLIEEREEETNVKKSDKKDEVKLEEKIEKLTEVVQKQFKDLEQRIENIEKTAFKKSLDGQDDDKDKDKKSLWPSFFKEV
jgi:signal transduction histidine kinase